jgi:Mce-associated membrane protein
MTVDQDSQADDADEAAQNAPQRKVGVVGRLIRQSVTRWRLILLALLVIAAAGLTAGLFFFQYRPDQQINAAAERDVVKAAADGSVALLSYSPDSLDRDFAAGRSHLTGNFLSYYSDFTQQIVTPAAQQKGLKTTANIARAAVSELHPDSAVVLVFINQATMSKDKPEPILTASSVKVTLTKVNGSWLISSFDPV